MIAASFPSPPVDLLSPQVVMAGALGQGCHRFPQALVARSAKACHLALARLDGYGAHPGVCGQSLVGRVALPALPDLRHQRGGRERTVVAQKQREKYLSIWVRSHRPCDPLLQALYPFYEHLESLNKSQHRFPSGLHLGLPCPPLGSLPQPLEQLRSALASTVAVATEETFQALLS